METRNGHENVRLYFVCLVQLIMSLDEISNDSGGECFFSVLLDTCHGFLNVMPSLSVSGQEEPNSLSAVLLV